MTSNLHIQRYFLTGLLTVFPLWLTYIVFEFVLRQLSRIGAPIVDAIGSGIVWLTPALQHALAPQWLRFVLAVILTVAFLYLLGWTANRVLGRRLLGWVDHVIERIPLVQPIYGGTKKLLTVLQNKPTGSQRVVLIEFPRPGMKAVGLVTRVFRDTADGRELAAVYVPTTPNPTGGYLEIVPVESLTPTDWTVDQAMAFILSGGAVSPENLVFGRRAGEVTQPEAPDTARPD